MKSTYLMFSIFLRTTLGAITKPTNDPMDHTCPNPRSVITASLNGPSRSHVTEIEQEICTPGAQTTTFQGDSNVLRQGHYSTIMPEPRLDRIPEVLAVQTKTDRLAPQLFMVLFPSRNKIKPHSRLLTQLLP